MNFRGITNPEVYILDYHNDNVPEEYPLSGPRGDFVLSLLGSYSLLDSVRIANPAIQGKETVESDIITCNPKLIIGLGSQAVKEYLNSNRPITDLSGNIFDIKIQNTEFKLLVLLSPTYVLKKIDDSSLTLKFSQDLYKALQFINGEYVDILKTKEILSAHTFKEFKFMYESRFLNDPEISYDIETNARPPMMEGSRIIGFSIANKTSGVYASIDSLDFHMSKEEEDQIWEFLIHEVFDKKSKLIIHNTMYERPYTLYCKDYEISFDKAHDTLVMARLLRSPKESAGLKYQAQKYLHYPDWETDLTTYISVVTDFINRIGCGPNKFRNLYLSLVNSDCIDGIFDIINFPEYNSLNAVDKDEVLGIINKIKSVLVDLYNDSEIKSLGVMLKEKIIETVRQGGIKDAVIPYNWIPDKLLSKYGAVDSLATFDLKDYFFDIMDKESTDKVDLHKGYQNWLEHMYVAYVMERNGMYWNDELALKDRKILSEKATKCLKELLKSPLFVPFIEKSCEELYKPLILSDYLPQIANSQGYIVIYDRVLNTYKITDLNGKRVNKGVLSSIVIQDSYKKQYLSIIQTLFYELIDKAASYEELKDIYNPSSITSKYIPESIFLDQELQIGGKINELHALSISPKFEPIKNSIPAIDQKFLQVADLICEPDKLKETYGETWASVRKQLYDGFVSLYKGYRKSVTTSEILTILTAKNPVVIETFDDEGIIKIYDNIVINGVDPDNENTWNDKFKWLVNFRIFKKAIKIISTYIDGSLGHQTVSVVNEKDLRSGKHSLSRKRKYSEGIAKSGESYLLMSNWSPNTAETGRWRSSFHTLPWTSPVKKYYESRFIGGCTVCPDYSAMEVRTLAAISKDPNMIELFKEGKDFHRRTASSIFRKPEDQITSAERRFSKAGTFSILYGSSVNSFANKYCAGDISYAEQIYEGFYRAYPKAKEWMDERHREVLAEHKVSLELSNRFIPIPIAQNEGQGEINSALRRSVNYPIQGQSADVTGCVIFDLQKYIEENNMKSLVFMYVHDSIEVDVYPYEFFKFISYLKYLLNEAPQRRMGLISEADVALGKSLGDEIGLVELQVSDDFTSGTMVLEGYKDEIDETVENWKKAYKTVEVSEENYKNVFTSMSELFIMKKAYSTIIGTTRQKGTCKVFIDYYK